MNESILNSIKRMLGLEANYKPFDTEIMAHINAAFMELAQLGVVNEGFAIEDDTATWAACLLDNRKLEAIRTCIYLKVRLLFDPPSASLAEVMTRTIDRLEWRLNIAAESKE